MVRNPLLPPVHLLIGIGAGVLALIVLASIVVTVVLAVRHRRTRQ